MTNYYWLASINPSGVEATPVAIAVTNPVLVFSASSFPENTSAGSVVAALSVDGLPGGVTVSSYAITVDPDSKFQIDGSNLELSASVDFETDTSHSVTIEATLSNAAVVEGTQVFTVTNVFEQPSLAALTLDTPTVEEATAPGVLVGSLQDVTPGSTLSLTDTAGNRFALDGEDIETGATATDYSTATSHNITVRETLADSVNSPRDSVISIAVTEAFSAPVLSSFSLSGIDDIWATINVTTDTGSGTLWMVIVPTAAAAPSAAQIKAGQNGSGGAATWAGSLAVSSSGAKAKLAYGLAVNTTYDAYVVQEVVGGDSNIVTDEFTTLNSTILARHAEDGATTGLSSTTGTLGANAADSLGGTNAVSFVDLNQGTSGALTIPTQALTFNNGVNRVRVRARRVSSSSPNLWMRINPSNTTVTSTTHVNLTARTNSGATQNWASATVTDLDGTWIQFDGTINMTGADVAGLLTLSLGDANNDVSILRDGTVSIAVHDLIISH